MDIYFLIFSLFFPRTVLLVYILLFPAQFPNNAVPQWADIVMGVLVPRILILIYIYQNMGAENVWFITHLIVLLVTYFSGGRETTRRVRPKKI